MAIAVPVVAAKKTKTTMIGAHLNEVLQKGNNFSHKCADKKRCILKVFFLIDPLVLLKSWLPFRNIMFRERRVQSVLVS